MKLPNLNKTILLAAFVALAVIPVSVQAFSPSPINRRNNVMITTTTRNNNILHGISNNELVESATDATTDADVALEGNMSSRRQWVIQSTSTTTAAAILALRPQTSYAATDTLEKPTLTTAVTVTDADAPDILCDPSVSIFQHPGKNNRIVYILGTAHISSKSAEAAGQLVRDIKPKAVFVELDAKRVGRAIPKPKAADAGAEGGGDSATDSDGASSTVNANTSASANANTNTSTSTEEGQVPAVATAAKVSVSSVNVISSTSQQQENDTPTTTTKKPRFFDVREIAMRKGSQLIGNQIKGLYSKLESEGFNAGEEFTTAVKEGLKIDAKIILGDRDVEVTLRRLTEALSKTDLKKLLAADSELEENMKQLMPKEVQKELVGNGSGDAMSTEQLKYFVETVKAKDNVKLLMNNLKSVAPEIYEAMVAERDLYMANGLDGLDQFESIVAVMGIAHVDGVENTLRSRGWVELKPSCPTAL